MKRKAELYDAKQEGLIEASKKAYQEKVESVINFTKIGLTPEQIGEGLSLSLDEIKRIQVEHSLSSQ
ncbi:hypothetical protein [uncultured Vagococcus sp.]|uniref:hypothetical protein n=1 Tax=uncultured Vagococcus sp. TaxID=189676 RepID=UPI0028D879D7|nr:hypothetical protein [uncultured Vagococcus sp.]